MLFSPSVLAFLFPLSQQDEARRFGGKRPGISFPLSYLARENKRVDVMRNLTIVSQHVEDTLLKRPVLPRERIKKGRKIFWSFCLFTLLLTALSSLLCCLLSTSLLLTNLSNFVVKTSFWHDSLFFQLHLSFLWALFPDAPLLPLCPVLVLWFLQSWGA